jgi:hypothetical protein
VAFNTTLTALHLSRKGIKDPEGVVLAKMLNDNHVLRKLELEGNLLGPNSASEFGISLKSNTSLKFLDLESNQLSQDGFDFKGVYDLIKVSLNF